jgi:hypothetical protein
MKALEPYAEMVQLLSTGEEAGKGGDADPADLSHAQAELKVKTKNFLDFTHR